MPTNGKAILEKFQKIAEDDILTISKEMDYSIEYTRTLLNKLSEEGLIEKVDPSSSQDRLVYRIKRNENNNIKLHPYWYELIKYVKENGGHLKLSIRFKDGIPIEADEIKKKVRFDINARTPEET